MEPSEYLVSAGPNRRKFGVCMQFKKSTSFLCLLAFTFLVPPSIKAQEVTAAITGTVTDPSGAPIAGASVVATDTARGTAWPTITNETGSFSLPRIPVGTYNVKITATGFQSAVRQGILLVLNQTARIDAQMQVGTINQTVEVTSAAPHFWVVTKLTGVCASKPWNWPWKTNSSNWSSGSEPPLQVISSAPEVTGVPWLS